jgi:hypothetical protein
MVDEHPDASVPPQARNASQDVALRLRFRLEVDLLPPRRSARCGGKRSSACSDEQDGARDDLPATHGLRDIGMCKRRLRADEIE